MIQYINSGSNLCGEVMLEKTLSDFKWYFSARFSSYSFPCSMQNSQYTILPSTSRSTDKYSSGITCIMYRHANLGLWNKSLKTVTRHRYRHKLCYRLNLCDPQAGLSGTSFRIFRSDRWSVGQVVIGNVAYWLFFRRTWKGTGRKHA